MAPELDPFARFRAVPLGKQGEKGEKGETAPDPERDRALTPAVRSHPAGEVQGEKGETQGKAHTPGGGLTLSHPAGKSWVRLTKKANPADSLVDTPASHPLTHLTLENVEAGTHAPIATPAPRDLPAPPVPGLEPVLLTAEDLAPVPGSPHADLEADWRAALARAREGYARRGGAPGGRDAHKFVRDAATLECLRMTRKREFTVWDERWRACLKGVYAGKVALLPGLERDLLATWRPKLAAEDDGMRVCRDCGGEFQRPADLPLRVSAQRCKACGGVRPENL